MDNNKNYIAYEYRKIAVKNDFAQMYVDCLQNFGWEPIEEHASGYGYAQMGMGPLTMGVNMAIQATQSSSDIVDDIELITLKFRRDSRIVNKHELDRLEHQCMFELGAIHKVERSNNAKTMGISLGTGIVGAACLTGAILNFRADAILPGVLFLIPAIAGWALGFFLNIRLRKKSEQTTAQIDKHYEEVYATCESAHNLLA